MTSAEHDRKTIDGYPVVQIVAGERTGDDRSITADGRVWTRLQVGEPSTLLTGVTVRAVRDAM